MELLTNAIEHGNLEFGFEKKKKLLWDNSWTNALNNRLSDAEYGWRNVHVLTLRKSGGLQIVIKDQGKGFDWQRYIYNDAPGTLSDPNGRGISKAMVMLDDLQYVGNGSEVHCHIPLGSLLN